MVRDQVKVGSLVLLKQENLPPLSWNLGRIVAVFPGEDQHVRVVEVRTAKGLYKRAITEVYLLPLDDNEEKTDSSIGAATQPIAKEDGCNRPFQRRPVCSGEK